MAEDIPRQDTPNPSQSPRRPRQSRRRWLPAPRQPPARSACWSVSCRKAHSPRGIAEALCAGSHWRAGHAGPG